MAPPTVIFRIEVKRQLSVSLEKRTVGTCTNVSKLMLSFETNSYHHFGPVPSTKIVDRPKFAFGRTKSNIQPGNRETGATRLPSHVCIIIVWKWFHGRSTLQTWNTAGQLGLGCSYRVLLRLLMSNLGPGPRQNDSGRCDVSVCAFEISGRAWESKSISSELPKIIAF